VLVWHSRTARHICSILSSGPKVEEATVRLGGMFAVRGEGGGETKDWKMEGVASDFIGARSACFFCTMAAFEYSRN
jgi:hypothetical protein